MNILPKKRWHVRTKENIARVRRDEAEAAEKERQEKLRTENADREARLNILKHKSKQKLLELGIEAKKHEYSEDWNGHINLFTDVDHAVKKTNKEHDKESIEKKEEYEKKIGYLTYLGQDTNEALKKKNWYELLPSERLAQPSIVKDTYDKLLLKDEEGKPKKKEIDERHGELDWKIKQCHDPIKSYKKYCSGKFTPKSDFKKVKETRNDSIYKIKQSKDKNNKQLKLKLLREARLKREQEEKYRTERFLSGLNKSNTVHDESNVKNVKPKYNSQFNPELARQNYR